MDGEERSVIEYREALRMMEDAGARTFDAALEAMIRFLQVPVYLDADDVDKIIAVIKGQQ